MDSANVTNTVVTIDGKTIDAHITPYSDNPLNLTSILILIDNSSGNPKHSRIHTLELNKNTIIDLLSLTTPRNLVGLYSFDTDISEKTPVGSPFSETRSKLKELKADGVGTRLYRRAMDAVDKIKSVKADRKAILVFSDGKDEDTGFNLDDLIKTAKDNKIIFITVGCSENAQGLPSLGNLEKLASQTGGLYIQLPLVDTDSGLFTENPDNLAKNILATIDSGASVVFNASDVKTNSEVLIKLYTKGGEILTKDIQHTKDFNVTPTPSPSPSANPSPSSSPSPTISATPSPSPATFADKVRLYESDSLNWIKNNPWSIAAAIAAILIITGISISLLKKSRKKKASMEATKIVNLQLKQNRSDVTDIYGWLMIQDSQSSKHPVRKTANTIGRRTDNDIVFTNDSVSGHHAEIHLERDRSFTITDLNSGNGTIVNGVKVSQTKLCDGDLVEIGEVRFRFKINS